MVLRKKPKTSRAGGVSAVATTGMSATRRPPSLRKSSYNKVLPSPESPVETTTQVRRSIADRFLSQRGSVRAQYIIHPHSTFMGVWQVLNTVFIIVCAINLVEEVSQTGIITSSSEQIHEHIEDERSLPEVLVIVNTVGLDVAGEAQEVVNSCVIVMVFPNRPSIHVVGSVLE